MKRIIWTVIAIVIVPALAWLDGWNFEIVRGKGLALTTGLMIVGGAWMWFAPWWSDK